MGVSALSRNAILNMENVETDPKVLDMNKHISNSYKGFIVDGDLEYSK